MAKSPKTPRNKALIIAFVQGAKWWEYHKTGATMWPSDQNEAEEVAKRKLKNNSLGETFQPK